MARRKKIEDKLRKLLATEDDIEFNKVEFNAKQMIEEKKAKKLDEDDDD